MAASAASAAAAAGPFDNTSMWHNWTIWTAQHLPFLNMTRLTPSLDGLISAGPRVVMKLGRLGSYISIPGAVDGFGSFQQRVIPEATEAAGNMAFQAVSSLPVTGTLAAEAAAGAARAAAGAASAAGAGASAGAAGDQAFSGTLSASAALLSTESARGLGSLFSYATSKWALCCVATAVILNRTYIFAATRRRIRLPWTVRFLIRILPIVSFIMQARKLLQSIQCQTSPNFAELRWGDATKHSDLLFAENSPLLHGLSSRLLFSPSDEASCIAVRMVPSEGYPTVADLRGSLSLLWPLFISFCVSHFIETLSCAVQGRPVAAETGMTLFEHSLAFAEADAAISSQLGWGSFVTSSASSVKSSTLAAVAAAATTAAAAGVGGGGGGGTEIPVSRSTILARVNTPPEVLLLAFLSAMSHTTSHILGVLNLQAKFRLISTGFWALCFMSSIVWSALTFSLDDPSGQGLLRFPTVAIVGFIPHMLVLMGILVCCFIYGSALLLAAASQEPDATTGNGNGNGDGSGQWTFRERLARAHANMQANLPSGNLRIGAEMDFYTALLRVGFDAITMASEAVYLNEDRRVNLRLQTWLEDERYNELQELRNRWLGSDLPGSRLDAVGATGLIQAAGGNISSLSGYARERTAQKVASGNAGDRTRPIRTGIGASERSGRWVMAVEYLVHVSKLVLSLSAVYLCRLLAYVGIRSQPLWLRRFVQRRKAGHSGGEAGEEGGVDGLGDDEMVKEWLDNSKIGSVWIHRSSDVDVEHEVRQRVTSGMGDLSGSLRREEREIDNRLYQWWLKGGWWGETDASGDYEPSIAADEDASSVISAFDEIASESGWESTGDGDNDDNDNDSTDCFRAARDGRGFGYSGGGQRTPTQRSPMTSRQGTPARDMPMEMPELARLLDPRSPEERAEAQALAAHLKSDKIMTRSAFAQFRRRQRAEVLATSRFNGGVRRLADFRPGVRLSHEEEAQLLEELLISRRTAARDGDEFGAAHASASWATGAAGLGPDGPQCVVCQSAPRTIIVWPCRCLSLCDDCRVSLAMNNFDKCVCCRREVVSFSRIYVP